MKTGETLLREFVGRLLWSTHLCVEDKLAGGLADDKTSKDFDPASLKAGIKVELEHTNDRELAREIAMDHLTEDPLYYDKLKTIEAFDKSIKSDSSYKKKSVYVPKEDKDEINNWLDDMEPSRESKKHKPLA